MKQLWSGRIAQAAGKYGENAPMAAVCCNACRTCATTNLVGLVMASAATMGLGARRLVRSLARPDARLRSYRGSGTTSTR